MPVGFIERENVLFDNRQPLEAGEAPPPLEEVSGLAEEPRLLLQLLRRHEALAGARVFTDYSAVPPRSR